MKKIIVKSILLAFIIGMIVWGASLIFSFSYGAWPGAFSLVWGYPLSFTFTKVVVVHYLISQLSRQPNLPGKSRKMVTK